MCLTSQGMSLKGPGWRPQHLKVPKFTKITLYRYTKKKKIIISFLFKKINIEYKIQKSAFYKRTPIFIHEKKNIITNVFVRM